MHGTEDTEDTEKGQRNNATDGHGWTRIRDKTNAWWFYLCESVFICGETTGKFSVLSVLSVPEIFAERAGDRANRKKGNAMTCRFILVVAAAICAGAGPATKAVVPFHQTKEPGPA